MPPLREAPDDRVRRAQEAIDRDRLAELTCQLVDCASPTGDEAELAGVIADLLSSAGAEARVQPIDERQANAWGRLRGEPGGRTLMLYAPIDTMTTGDPRHDVPHAAREMEPHLRPRAEVVDGRVVGLGAMNPKGHVACILGAMEVIAHSGVQLPGDLIAAFGAGGMPTNSLPDPDGVTRRHHTGQGVGCSFLLEQGVWADAALIAKSGWAVSWEEVGLAWCDVTVTGLHTYVGARHLLPYRNAIADAAAVITHLEAWFERRARKLTAGHVAPQAVVGAIDAGWWRMPAFPPAHATVRVDIRLPPGQSPLDARRELEDALAELIATDPGLKVDVELVLGIPGSRTDPDHWIVTTAIDAWETEVADTHEPATATSGATDANILRNRGLPTVRVGLPKSTAPDGTPLGFGPGMNTVDIDALEVLTRYLVRLAIEATARPAETSAA